MTFQALVGKSLRLQARVIHLDQLLYIDPKAAILAPDQRDPVEEQLARLRAAFG